MKLKSLAVLLVLALPALGREAIQVYDITEAGSGCPAGTGDVQIDVDDGELNVDFSSLRAEMRGGRLAREVCMFAAKAKWPRGYQIVISDVNLKGRYTLRSGTRGAVHSELFTTGGVGEAIDLSLSGSGHFDETESGEVYRSDCSGSGLLRMNSSVRVTSAGGFGSGSVRLSSLNAELSLEKCN
jgi:hypothetical protein